MRPFQHADHPFGRRRHQGQPVREALIEHEFRHVIAAGDLYLAGAQTAAFGLCPQRVVDLGVKVFRPASRTPGGQAVPIDLRGSFARRTGHLVGQCLPVIAHEAFKVGHDSAAFINPVERGHDLEIPVERGLAARILKHRHGQPVALREIAVLLAGLPRHQKPHRITISLRQRLQHRARDIAGLAILFHETDQRRARAVKMMGRALQILQGKFRFPITHVAPSQVCRCILWGIVRHVQTAWRRRMGIEPTTRRIDASMVLKTREATRLRSSPRCHTVALPQGKRKPNASAARSAACHQSAGSCLARPDAQAAAR